MGTWKGSSIPPSSRMVDFVGWTIGYRVLRVSKTGGCERTDRRPSLGDVGTGVLGVLFSFFFLTTSSEQF
jgi:hypothetical protein